MAIETDATRLAMIKAVGGEEFDSGCTESLWGVFDRESVEAIVGDHVVRTYRPRLECRTADVETHGLVKGSVLKRVSDGRQFAVKDFEDDGTGMTVIILGA